MSATPSPLPDASATARGAVNTIAQAFAGLKTFNGDLVATGPNGFILPIGKAIYFSNPAASDYMYSPSGAGVSLVSASGPLVLAGIGGANLFFGYGTPSADLSASPGAQTINKPSGRASIAIGSSAVAIANSFVAAGDQVVITALGRDATCRDLVVDSVSNGGFVVSGTANATAAAKFMFTVVKAF